MVFDRTCWLKLLHWHYMICSYDKALSISGSILVGLCSFSEYWILHFKKYWLPKTVLTCKISQCALSFSGIFWFLSFSQFFVVLVSRQIDWILNWADWKSGSGNSHSLARCILHLSDLLQACGFCWMNSFRFIFPWSFSYLTRNVYVLPVVGLLLNTAFHSSFISSLVGSYVFVMVNLFNFLSLSWSLSSFKFAACIGLVWNRSFHWWKMTDDQEMEYW